MNLNEIKFDELSIKEIGSWPKPLRIAALVVVAAVAVALVYFVLLRSKIELVAQEAQQEQAKRNEFKEKYNLAANITEYEKQITEVDTYYKKILKELPIDSQIAELIDNISGLAEKNHLKYDSIKLGEPTINSSFYKELTLELILKGSYHNFGKFIADLSKLPRIVTMHDFTIRRAEGKSDMAVGAIIMNMKVKTYWQATEKEQAEYAAANKAKEAKTSNSGAPSQDAGGTSPPGARLGGEEKP